MRIARIRSEELEDEGPERMLAGYDGILVPGGFGERGIEGKIAAIRYAREKGVPFFGICLGMQCAVIEFARNVCGLAGAHSTEFDKETPAPGDLPARRAEVDHRQGRHDAARRPAGAARPGQRIAASCYGSTEISERHRHRYEFNNIYRQQFAANGLQCRRHEPRRQRWSRSSSCRSIAGSSPCSIIRSSSRSRRRRIRCSPASSPRRSPTVTAKSGRTPLVGRDECDVRPAPHTRHEVTNTWPDRRKKIIIDEDWKSQVAAEKEAAQTAAPQHRAASRASGAAPGAAIFRCRPRRSRCLSRRSSPRR